MGSIIRAEKVQENVVGWIIVNMIRLLTSWLLSEIGISQGIDIIKQCLEKERRDEIEQPASHLQRWHHRSDRYWWDPSNKQQDRRRYSSICFVRSADRRMCCSIAFVHSIADVSAALAGLREDSVLVASSLEYADCYFDCWSFEVLMGYVETSIDEEQHEVFQRSTSFKKKTRQVSAMKHTSERRTYRWARCHLSIGYITTRTKCIGERIDRARCSVMVRHTELHRPIEFAIVVQLMRSARVTQWTSEHLRLVMRHCRRRCLSVHGMILGQWRWQRWRRQLLSRLIRVRWGIHWRIVGVRCCGQTDTLRWSRLWMLHA